MHQVTNLFAVPQFQTPVSPLIIMLFMLSTLNRAIKTGYIFHTLVKLKLRLTKEELDFWYFEALESWEVACVVAAWEFSMFELISSERWSC